MKEPIIFRAIEALIADFMKDTGKKPQYIYLGQDQWRECIKTHVNSLCIQPRYRMPTSFDNNKCRYMFGDITMVEVVEKSHLRLS